MLPVVKSALIMLAVTCLTVIVEANTEVSVNHSNNVEYIKV